MVHRSSLLLSVCALLLLPAAVLVLLAGCSRQRGGESLDAQYRRALEVADSEARVTQLLGVAGKQHKAGDARGVMRSLTSAADAAREISDSGGRTAALNRIGMAAARMDLPEEAKSLFREVRKQLGDEAPEAQVSVLARIAYAQGKYLNQPGEAAEVLARAEAAAGAIERPEARSTALLELALTCFGLQQTEDMQRLLDRAQQDARALEDPRRRAEALAGIGAALSRMKQPEEAKTVFQEAQQTARAIADPLSQGYAYVALSGKLSDAGLPGAAQKILQLAETAADSVPDTSLRNSLLENIHAARRAR